MSFLNYQNKKAREAVGDTDVIRLGTTLVEVPVTVREIGGRYITNLKKEDFRLYEDGVEQQIEFFGTVDERFSVVLLIDSSGSTASQLEIIKTSATAFLEEVRGQDQVAVISFNDSVTVLSELTQNREVLKEAIQAIMPGEYTQVYEGVYTAVWEKLADVKGRKAVVIFSDGIDTGSTEINKEDTLDAIVESEDVLVYPIRYNTKVDVMRKLEPKWGKLNRLERQEKIADLDNKYKEADEYLEELARLSGGGLENANRLSDLRPALMRIANELRQQYTVGYYVKNTEDKKRERGISVRVNRVGVIVRTRPTLAVRK
jgi:VWFA-related protein